MIPEAEYNSIPAIRASFLKACSFSAWHGWNYLHAPQYESDAMKFGSAVHAAILEPEKFVTDYRFSPKFDKRTKAGKEGAESFAAENVGKIILDETDHFKIQSIVAKCQAIPAVADALKTFEKEKSFKWESEYGLMKAQLDLVDVKNKIIIDIKTTRDANPREFLRQSMTLRYPVQFHHYIQAVGADSECYVIAVESESEEVAMYNITEIVTSTYTQMQYAQALKTAKEVSQMTERPAKFAREIVKLSLPSWTSAEMESAV